MSIAATMSSSSTPTRSASPATSWREKIYYKHTGYAGGIKEITAAKVLDGRFPERVLEKAVERMIPRGPLGRDADARAAPLQRHRASARRPEPETLDVASHEPQEQGGRMMSDNRQSLSDLADLTIGRAGRCRRPPAPRSREPAAPAAEPRPGAVRAAARAGARQAGPRLRHRPPQGRGRPRLAQARHRQDHGQRPRPGSLFRPSDAAPGHQPAVRRSPTARASTTSSAPSTAAGFRARPARSSTASARR